MIRHSDPPPKSDPQKPTERKSDIATFVLAGLLAAIIVAAIGYGIFNSARMTTAVPTKTAAHSIAH